jgi:hypothetical protein
MKYKLNNIKFKIINYEIILVLLPHQVLGQVVNIYYFIIFLGFNFVWELYFCSKSHSVETSTMLEQVPQVVYHILSSSELLGSKFSGSW